MISTEYLDFLNVLSLCLHGEGSKVDTQKDWDFIYKEGVAQAIVPLLAALLPNASWGMNQNDALLLYANNLQVFHSILEEQDKLKELLEAHGIKHAVMKGFSAAKYYPNPECRTMGDIDLLIEQEHFEEIQPLFESAGYVLQKGLNRKQRHMEFVSKSEIVIEPHLRFSSSNDERQNAILDDLLKNALNSDDTIEYNGHFINTLPEVENGLVLISHINHHLCEGLGLRQIIDWMYYAENVLTDEFWEKSFEGVVESIGLKRLALVVTAMCKRYLGLAGDAAWYEDVLNDDIVDELMVYIMNHGNFGVKDQASSRTIFTIRKLRNPIEGLKYAQAAGEYNWKLLRKHPWLKCFAWLYQCIRWSVLLLRSGLKANSVSNREKEEYEFLMRLGATRI